MSEFTINLLEKILDTKDSEKFKNGIRNFMVPMVEYVEDGESPEDVMTRLRFLLHMFAVPTAIALDIAIKERSHKSTSLQLSEKYYKEVNEILELLHKASEKARKKEKEMEEALATMEKTLNDLGLD